MRSKRALCTGLVAAAVLAVCPAAARIGRAAGPRRRDLLAPAYPGSGYFTSLSAKGVGCATARKVTLAHYRCRTRTGRRGRCHHRVMRYRCSETRVAISTESTAASPAGAVPGASSTRTSRTSELIRLPLTVALALVAIAASPDPRAPRRRASRGASAQRRATPRGPARTRACVSGSRRPRTRPR